MAFCFSSISIFSSIVLKMWAICCRSGSGGREVEIRYIFRYRLFTIFQSKELSWVKEYHFFHNRPVYFRMVYLSCIISTLIGHYSLLIYHIYCSMSNEIGVSSKFYLKMEILQNNCPIPLNQMLCFLLYYYFKENDLKF